MRSIRRGEEITKDYAINGYYEADSEDCNCCSENCRKKTIPNFFKLPKSLRIKYVPYLDSWFRRQFEKQIQELSRRGYHYL